MLAQIGLGAAARALLVPFVLVGAGGVLLLLALLTLWLLVAGIRAWNIRWAPGIQEYPEGVSGRQIAGNRLDWRLLQPFQGRSESVRPKPRVRFLRSRP